MKKSLIFILAASLFAGCSSQTPDESLGDFKCTIEQMKVVESQTRFCIENTGYLSTHCYVSAMKRNCEKFK